MANAQGGLLFQGIADLELWKTDSASSLLARSAGSAGPLVRLDMWAAIEPLANLVFFGELSGETGRGRDEAGSELYAKQFGARYSPAAALNFEAGRIRQMVGTVSSRQLSFRNPLSGTPDGYATTYPYGAHVDGNAGMGGLSSGHPDPSAVPFRIRAGSRSGAAAGISTFREGS